MEAKHTATPWDTYEQPAPHDEREKTQVIVWKETGATLAILGGYSPIEQRANAAFIVRACNAHDELVKALQDIVALPAHPMRKRAVEIAAAALAKVQA